jgi:pilus assembly protein CpaE
MRAGVREVLPSPVTPSALDAAVNRIGAKLVSAQAKNTGKILAFMPCKGGSGATFLATNLGYQLAETKTVLLIDLNLQFGDALSFVHDGKPTSTLADIARDIGRLDASFLAASSVKIAPNYSIMAAPEDPSQAIEVKPEHIDAILGLAVTQYDFILLDMNRTLDTLSIKALDRAYRIYPVLQAELAYLRNAGKLLNAFKALGYPKEKMELIVNRFEKSGEIGLDDIQRTLGSISLRTVPSSYKEVSTSINQGNPLIKMARSNAVTKKLVELMSSVSPKQEESRGFLERMFRRA